MQINTVRNIRQARENVETLDIIDYYKNLLNLSDIEILKLDFDHFKDNQINELTRINVLKPTTYPQKLEVNSSIETNTN
jgi:hypothetical protein